MLPSIREIELQVLIQKQGAESEKEVNLRGASMKSAKREVRPSISSSR